MKESFTQAVLHESKDATERVDSGQNPPPPLRVRNDSHIKARHTVEPGVGVWAFSWFFRLWFWRRGTAKPFTAADIAEAKAKRDIDDFILAELKNLQVFPIWLDDPTPILADKYLDNSQKISTYLTTLRRPPEIDTK